MAAITDLDVAQDQKSSSVLKKEAVMTVLGIVAIVGFLIFMGAKMAKKENVLKGIA